MNPNIGELHTDDANHMGAATLVVIYCLRRRARSRLPQPAYELHPVTFCCKTSPVTDCDPNQVIFLRKRWQDAVNNATSPATLENQKLPRISGRLIR